MWEIFIQIIVSIVAYFIVLFLSTNFLGLLVRGFFTDPEIDKLKQDGSEFIKREVEKSQRGEKWVNLIALLLIIAYFYALFHFWNIGVVLAAAMIMVARFPDLIWEIKHGRKIDPKLLPKDAKYFIGTLLSWGALPVLYYSLYYF